MKVESLSFAGAVMPRVTPAADSVERDRRESLEQPASAPDQNKVQPEELIGKIKALTQNGAYSVRFEMDEKADQLIIRLVDVESGEMIRQIPAKELLGLAACLKDLRGNILEVEG